MRVGEKIRAYAVEPVLASLTLAALGDYFPFSKLAEFMHSEARDLLSLMLVLLASALALWVGLFWISNTPFGIWLAEKGEIEAIHSTYIYSVIVLFAACLGCIVAAFVNQDHLVVEDLILWLSLFALYGVPFLMNNTRQLLRLYSAFVVRNHKVARIDRQAESK
jgi:hypothetical protein